MLTATVATLAFVAASVVTVVVIALFAVWWCAPMWRHERTREPEWGHGSPPARAPKGRARRLP